MECFPIKAKEMNNLNEDSYNKIAHEWDAIRGKTFVSKLITDFADKITPNGKILDVGCGSGNPVIYNLSRQNFEIIGIDAALEMI